MLVIEASSDETEENCDDDDDEEQGNRRKVRGKSTRSLAKKRSAPMRFKFSNSLRVCANATRHPFLITILLRLFCHCTKYDIRQCDWTLAACRIEWGVVSSFSYFSRSCPLLLGVERTIVSRREILTGACGCGRLFSSVAVRCDCRSGHSTFVFSLPRISASVYT